MRELPRGLVCFAVAGGLVVASPSAWAGPGPELLPPNSDGDSVEDAPDDAPEGTASDAPERTASEDSSPTPSEPAPEVEPPASSADPDPDPEAAPLPDEPAPILLPDVEADPVEPVEQPPAPETLDHDDADLDTDLDTDFDVDEDVDQDQSASIDDDYDPRRDSPEAQTARRWLGAGIGATITGAVLVGGAIAMSQTAPCDPAAGNSCFSDARDRAAVTMGAPGGVLLLGGVAMTVIGALQKRRVKADFALAPSVGREQLGLVVVGRF